MGFPPDIIPVTAKPNLLCCLSLTDPCLAVSSIGADESPSPVVSDTAVDSMVQMVDGDGNVVEELEGIMMMF